MNMEKMNKLENAADLCGIGNDLGTIEVGKIADLIMVRANPLEDIQKSSTITDGHEGGTHNLRQAITGIRINNEAL